MHKRLLIILCALLALTAEFYMVSVAVAVGPWSKNGVTEEGLVGTEVYVYTYNLPVYEKPTKKSRVMEIVPFAKRILRIAEKKGWAQVFTTNGRLGYCNAKQLTEIDPNIYDTTVYSQQNRAPVYLRPSVESPLIGHLNRDETTTLVAVTPKHDWMRIKAGKYYGYIQRPRIDFKKYKEGKDAWINRQSVQVFYDTDVDSTFSTLYFGQHLHIVSRENGWAKIRSDGGVIGFCDFAALTDIDPNSLDIPVYTQVEGNYLFTSSTDLSGRRLVARNEEMLLSAVDDDLFWARVRYHDAYFYVPYVFLGTEKRTGDYKRVTAATDLSIHEGTTLASKIVTNVPVGTELWLIGCTDSKAKVATDAISNGARFIGFVDIHDIQ